jgi:hypothetical protein
MAKLWWLIFCFIPLTVHAQYTTTLRMQVVTGQQVSFIFNRFDQFNNGISKLGYTQVKIYYNSVDLDSNPYLPSKGWKLYVKADQATFTNFFGSETIPLDALSLDYVQTGGESLSGTINPLTSGSPGILIGEWVNTDPNDRLNAVSTITLTYNCGGPLYNLANEADGQYFINLEFEVIEEL